MCERPQHPRFLFDPLNVIHIDQTRNFQSRDHPICNASSAPDETESTFANDTFDFPTGNNRLRPRRTAKNAD
jgi:hypothetical protein